MNSKGEKNKERIDLGLGAILAAAQPARDVEISIELGKPAEQAPSSPWTLGGSEAPVKSEFDILADERKWSEIVRRVESTRYRYEQHRVRRLELLASQAAWYQAAWYMVLSGNSSYGSVAPTRTKATSREFFAPSSSPIRST